MKKLIFRTVLCIVFPFFMIWDLLVAILRGMREFWFELRISVREDWGSFVDMLRHGTPTHRS